MPLTIYSAQISKNHMLRIVKADRGFISPTTGQPVEYMILLIEQGSDEAVCLAHEVRLIGLLAIIQQMVAFMRDLQETTQRLGEGASGWLDTDAVVRLIDQHFACTADDFKMVIAAEENPNPWMRVVFFAECSDDGGCPVCAQDFADCPCPGPTQEDHEYQERDGVLYARRSV